MNCNFDLGHTCMLEQDIDDNFDWDVSKYGSEVAGTGPSGDRTLSEGDLVFCFISIYTCISVYFSNEYLCISTPLSVLNTLYR